jgi:hypothetical protein
MPLEILNFAPADVIPFPNWNVPPTVFLVPPPLINPRSSSVDALLGFWKTIVPPEKLKFPAEVTFKEPTLLSPFPIVLRVVVPPEMSIPEVIPGGDNVPEAVFSSLPAMFTVPPVTIKAPSI